MTDNNYEDAAGVKIRKGVAMKRVIEKITGSFGSKRRSRDALFMSCQEVCRISLDMKHYLRLVGKLLYREQGRKDARVVARLEWLASRAYRLLSDRLMRLSGSDGSFPMVIPPLQTDEELDSSGQVVAWADVHAQLLTFLVQSVEACRGALVGPGISYDFVTKKMLVEVLEIFEEMGWMADSYATQINLHSQVGDQVNRSSGFGISVIKSHDCALVDSTSKDSLAIVRGTLEVWTDSDEPACFTPLADRAGNRIFLDKDITRRVTTIHPEKQALFSGCTHILELTTEELSRFNTQLTPFVEHPLSDSILESEGRGETPEPSSRH